MVKMCASFCGSRISKEDKARLDKKSMSLHLAEEQFTILKKKKSKRDAEAFKEEEEEELRTILEEWGLTACFSHKALLGEIFMGSVCAGIGCRLSDPEMDLQEYTDFCVKAKELQWKGSRFSEAFNQLKGRNWKTFVDTGAYLNMGEHEGEEEQERSIGALHWDRIQEFQERMLPTVTDYPGGYLGGEIQKVVILQLRRIDEALGRKDDIVMETRLKEWTVIVLLLFASHLLFEKGFEMKTKLEWIKHIRLDLMHVWTDKMLSKLVIRSQSIIKQREASGIESTGASKARNAAIKLRQGRIGDAYKVWSNRGVLPKMNVDIQDITKKKFPKVKEFHVQDMPQREAEVIIITPEEVAFIIRKMKRGKSPGFSGNLRGEYFYYLSKTTGPKKELGSEFLNLWARFLSGIANNSFPAGYKAHLKRIKAIVFVKKMEDGQVKDVRPISMMDTPSKQVEGIIANRNSEHLKEYFGNYQMGVQNPDGMSAVIFRLQEAIDEGCNVATADHHNAYPHTPATQAANCLGALLKEGGGDYVKERASSDYSLRFDGLELHTECIHQGAPLGSAAYGATIQATLEKADLTIREAYLTYYTDSSEDEARRLNWTQGYIDNGFLASARLAMLYQGLQEYQEGTETIGGGLKKGDTIILLGKDTIEMPKNALAGLRANLKEDFDLEDAQLIKYPTTAEERRNYGFVALGVPVGTPEYVKEKVSDLVQDIIARDSEVLTEVAKEDPQQAWHFLKSCRSSMAIMHLLRNVKPELISEAVTAFDNHIHRMVALITGQVFTQPGSLARLLTQDRISKGGLGLPALHSISFSAHLAASFTYLAKCHEFHQGDATHLAAKLNDLNAPCTAVVDAMMRDTLEIERPGDWPESPRELANHLLEVAMGGGKLQDKIQGIFKVQHNKEVQRRIQGESIQIRTVYKDLQSMTAGAFLMALPTDAHSTFSRDQFRSLIALRYSGISPLGWPPFLPTHLMCDCKHEIVDPQHIFNCKHLNKGNQGWTWVHDEIQNWMAKIYKSADPGVRIKPQEDEFRIPIIAPSNTVSSAENALDAEDDFEDHSEEKGSGIMDIVAMGYGREAGIRMFFDVSIASSGLAALFNADPNSNANLDFTRGTCPRRVKQKERHYGPGLKEYSTRRNIPVLLKPLIFDRLGNYNDNVEDFLSTVADSVVDRQGKDNISRGLLLHRLRRELSLRVAKAHARSFIFKLHRLRCKSTEQDLDRDAYALVDQFRVW